LRNLTWMKTSSLSSLREAKEMIMIVMKKDGSSLAHRRNPNRKIHLLAKRLKLQRRLLQESLFKKVKSYKLSTSVNMQICLTKNHLTLAYRKLLWPNHWLLNIDTPRKTGSSTGKPL
jgi:hypothetical protein